MTTSNKEAAAKYRANNRAKVNKAQNDRTKTFKGSVARAKRLLGATNETWQKHWDATECALCGKELPVGVAYHKHYDHDHATMEYRGTLCRECNHTLGYYEKCKRIGLDKLEVYCNGNY